MTGSLALLSIQIMAHCDLWSFLNGQWPVASGGRDESQR